MLYEDLIIHDAHYGARRLRGGQMLSSLPGKHHRPHMRLGGIIHALCCMRMTIIHYAHYGVRRLRGGEMLSSLPRALHRLHVHIVVL